MTWHYRAFKVMSKDKKKMPYYCVKEYFNTGRNTFWIEEAITPIGDTKKELIEILEMMLKDIKHYKTKVEKI